MRGSHEGVVASRTSRKTCRVSGRKNKEYARTTRTKNEMSVAKGPILHRHREELVTRSAGWGCEGPLDPEAVWMKGKAGHMVSVHLTHRSRGSAGGHINAL